MTSLWVLTDVWPALLTESKKEEEANNDKEDNNDLTDQSEDLGGLCRFQEYLHTHGPGYSSGGDLEILMEFR